MKQTLKRILSAVMALVMLCSLLPVSALAAEPTSGQCGDNVYWEFDEATGTLTISGEGEMDWCTMYQHPWPISNEQIEYVVVEKGVTGIGQCAFYGSGVRQATIADTVTYIAGSAFEGCDSLTSISIPDSVLWLGESVFKGCGSLKNVSLSNSMTYISESLFWRCRSLTSAVIPDGVTEIRGFAFSDCQSLVSVTIPNSVTRIGSFAFNECDSLKSVTIPYSVTVIDSWVFGGCSGLESITLSEGLTSIERSAFEDCTSLNTVTIPDSVVNIGESAFRNCDGLSELTLPNKGINIGYCAFYDCDSLARVKVVGEALPVRADLTSEMNIGREAFFSCDSLKSVTIPDGVTSIGDHAYSNCNSLTSVTIPESVTTIISGAFAACSSLTSIIIPDSVIDIGSSAFNGCSSLTSVKIPNGITYLAVDVFANCGSLTSVTIPDSVLTIDGAAFYNCSSLLSIKIPNSVKEIGWYAFWECNSLTEVKLPSSVTSIGDGAFRSCDSLKSVTIPEGVTCIGEEVFAFCSSLISVTIPNSVTNIGESAFTFCSSLISVTIPNSVTNIGDYAFSWCSGLTNVTISKSVTSIGVGVFNGCRNLENVHYGGTESQWNEIEIGSKNECLTDLKPHWTSTGTGNNDDDDNEGSYDIPSGSVHYFREWDEVNKITYWNDEYIVQELSLGSQVTESTDLSAVGGLEGIGKYVGSYVLAERKKRDDGKIAADLLVKILPVEAKTGTISSADSNAIVVDGYTYKPPKDMVLPETYQGAKVLYFLLNGTIVDFDVIAWADNTRPSPKPENKPNNRPDNNKPSYPEFDYNAPQPEPTNEEEYLDILSDVWEEKWNAFFEASMKCLDKISGTDEAKREAAIEREATRMQNEDNASPKNRFVTFGSNEQFPVIYRDEAYTALATMLYDEADVAFSFGKVDLSGKNAAVQIIESVMNSMYGSSGEYKYGNVVIRISIYRAGSSKFGSLTCEAKGRTYTAIICSTQKECLESLEQFTDELSELAINAEHNVYRAIAKDLGLKTISQLTKPAVTELVNKWEKKFTGVLADKLKIAGLGKYIDTLNTGYNYYSTIVRVSKNSFVELEKALKNAEGIKFDDSSISDKAVNKAYKQLAKASKNLNEWTRKVITGEANISNFKVWWKTMFNCPVSVTVYDSNGVQIGYVGEDDIWFDESRIIIEESGGSKVIYGLTDELLSYKVVGEDYGVMSCVMEEYDDDNNAIGRLNFYDAEIEPNKEFTTALQDDLLLNSKLIALKSENASILADEYISVDDIAAVDVTCEVVCDEGTDGGMVVGAGTYVCGDAAVLIAKANEGYNFAGWYNGDALMCIDPVYEFTAKEDVQLTAQFYYDNYVYIDVAAEEYGAVIGSTKYMPGEEATIYAYPEQCGGFVGWYLNDDLVSESAEYSFDAVEDGLYVAKFNEPVHTWDEGTVTKEPTSEEKGEITYTCSVCGKTRVEEVEQGAPDIEPISNPFTDVSESDWFYDSVMWAYQNNVTGGTSASTFGPNDGCTRAQVVTFLWAANGKPEPQSMDNPFKDVADDAWYAKPVLWAVENGITGGVSADKFGPNQTCTRGQIVTFLYAAEKKPAISGSSDFKDVKDTDWYAIPVIWAADNEVTGGIGDGKFGPNQTCTRGQVVTFLYKVYGNK